MQAVAKLKNVPMSARKMRMVADLIRGKSVDHALNLLKYNKKEGSIWCEKLLLSAIDNWEQKTDYSHPVEDHDLVVKTIMVDEGTMLKRFRPAPHGRAHRIRKRTNHVTIMVENQVDIDNAEDNNQES